MKDFFKEKLDTYGRAAKLEEYPIYYGTWNSAMGEKDSPANLPLMDAYLNATNASMACAMLIEENIDNNYDYETSHFDAEKALNETAEHFGITRIIDVIATTLNERGDGDGRFSQSVVAATKKRYADSVPECEQDVVIPDSVHSVLLNEFAKTAFEQFEKYNYAEFSCVEYDPAEKRLYGIDEENHIDVYSCDENTGSDGFPVAVVDENRNVTFLDNSLPDWVKGEIVNAADTITHGGYDFSYVYCPNDPPFTVPPKRHQRNEQPQEKMQEKPQDKQPEKAEKAESEVKDTAPKVKKKHHDDMER